MDFSLFTPLLDILENPIKFHKKAGKSMHINAVNNHDKFLEKRSEVLTVVYVLDVACKQ